MKQLQPDVVKFNGSITCCEKAAEWQHASRHHAAMTASIDSQLEMCSGSWKVSSHVLLCLRSVTRSNIVIAVAGQVVGADASRA